MKKKPTIEFTSKECGYLLDAISNELDRLNGELENYTHTSLDAYDKINEHISAYSVIFENIESYSLDLQKD